MEFISQIERTVLGWLKDVPHLPADGRKWLGDNVWWVVAIGAAVSGLFALAFFVAFMGQLSALTNPLASYFASLNYAVWGVVKTALALVFSAFICVLFVNAVTPLKAKQKKGWMLVFAALLLVTLSVIINSVLSFNIFDFLANIVASAVMVAIWTYFLFEIHSQFEHVEPPKVVKPKN